jgi:succinate dehydrogenase/fumarate reductase flavoprotein subunit
MREMYDVIVVGGGGSGLACAVAAVQRGADVLLLEKQRQLGGATGMAIGSFTASQTLLQRRAGIEDSPEDHEEDAAKFGPPEIQAKNNQPLRQYFLRQAADTMQWLTEMGLAFHGPSPEPPNRVPRMHNVVPNAKAYIAAFQTQFLQRGGDICCSAPVTQLVQQGGRVTGVVAEINGQPVDLRARCGVVLAAGDYANAADMIARFRGEQFAAVEGINPHAAGDGHRLAEQVGAEMVNMEITYGPELRFVAPKRDAFQQLLPSHGLGMRVMGVALPWVPRRMINWMIKRLLVTWQHPEDSILADGAILVNRAGRRFCNEDESPQREIAVASQPDKIAYLLLDQRLADRYSQAPNFISTAPEIAYAYLPDYLRLRRDVAVQGPSLEAVAAARHLPLDAIRETVAHYNQCLAEQEADSLGRRLNHLPLKGQRWALLGPVKAYFTTTEGGAAINQRMQVLDRAAQPISGLYAVGQNGLGGMVLWGHGLHIAWAITSGRLVGQSLGDQATIDRTDAETAIESSDTFAPHRPS